MHATIAVCTFRRPDQLMDLLFLLADQRAPAGWDYSILVVDNDERETARQVVEAFQLTRTMPEVRYVVEPLRGVGNARNAALHHRGDADVLIMFDDDQVPNANWLRSFLDSHTADPDAVWSGPVQPDLPSQLPLWARGGWPWRRPVIPDGQALSMAGDGNMLLPRRIAADYRYSPAYGQGMGQDTELVRRLTSAGTRIRHAAKASARERVPSHRIEPEWVLHRAKRSSLAWATIYLSEGPKGYLRVLLSAAKRTISGGLLIATGNFTDRPDLTLRGKRDLAYVRQYAAAIKRYRALPHA